MHLGVSLSNALQQLESVKAAVDQSDDPKLKAATNDDLNMLISLLESPILKSIATLQDSVGMLATQVAHHPSILPGDFDITPAGELALQTRNLYGAEGEEEQRVPQVSPPHCLEFGSSSDNERVLGLDCASIDSNMSPKQSHGILEISRNDDSLASVSPNIVAGDWAQVEIINLVNDGTGLGFGIIGARTSGVIVKTILAGGVADRDGRLKSGDHILQIGDAHLVEMGSEQVAGVLRASGSRVRLVVARAVDPALAPPAAAPLVPARLLSDPEALDRYLLETGFEQVFHTQPVHHVASRFVFDSAVTPPPETDAESPEVDRFTVQLKKDENGLGITIAGYVCEKEELSGIFVKSVSAGSAAALSGRVRVNDRIVAVDGASLAGKSNQRAVDALKQSGNLVTLELERYLRGPKYEQLQQAIAAGESAAVAVAHNPFLHMHRPEPASHDIQMTTLHKLLGVERGGALALAAAQPGRRARAARLRDAAHARAEGGYSEEVAVHIRRRRGNSSWSSDARRRWTGHLTRGHSRRGGRARGAAAPLRALRAARGARGPRRRAPARGRAARGERAPAARHEPPGGGVDPEGAVERGVHGVRAPAARARARAAARPRAARAHAGQEVNGHRLLGMNHLEVVSILKELSSEVCMVCARPPPAPAPFAAARPRAARAHAGQGEIGRQSSWRGRRRGRVAVGRQGALAQPRAAHRARHVVLRAADHRTAERRARARFLDPRLPGPAAAGAHAGGDPLAGAGRRGAARRETHSRRPAVVRQRTEPGGREPGAGGGGAEGRGARRGAHRRGQAAAARGRAAAARGRAAAACGRAAAARGCAAAAASLRAAQTRLRTGPGRYARCVRCSARFHLLSNRLK